MKMAKPPVYIHKERGVQVPGFVCPFCGEPINFEVWVTIQSLTSRASYSLANKTAKILVTPEVHASKFIIDHECEGDNDNIRPSIS